MKLVHKTNFNKPFVDIIYKGLDWINGPPIQQAWISLSGYI